MRAWVAAAVLAALLATGWQTLVPTALGGPATYVVTQGNSMLPTYLADGLVITREQDAYEIGDAVSYYNRDLESVVLHRIVARDGDRYVLQGDNNDFLDTYRPAQSELIGTEWVHLPGAGRWVRMLQDPPVFAGIIAAITLLSLRLPNDNRRRRRHHG